MRNRLLQRGLAPILPQSATFRVIDEIQVELPLHDRTGPGFYLNYGGPAAFYHYEEIEKVELLKALPDTGVFLDIGANIGLFSLYLSKLLPRVQCFAFEPIPLLAECLRKSVRQSPLPRIQVEEVCLGDRIENLQLVTHRENFGGNSIVPASIDPGEQGETIRVKGTTLDAWIAERPSVTRIDALKVDVQGAELLVLRGARSTLKKFRPFVLVEIENAKFLEGEGWEELPGLLERYSFRIAGAEAISPLAELKTVARQELSAGRLHTNYFLIP